MTDDEISPANLQDVLPEPQKEEAEAATKIGYLLKIEQILISRERFFAVASTVVTALFTVVLALSTVFLWKETKDLRDFAEQQSEDMKASIAEAARSADAMRDVAKALAAETEAARENLRAYITVGLIGVVPQNKDTGYRYEVRMSLQNVGNTPAYNVASNFYADILPNPLPQEFKVPSFNQKVAGESTVGPHQNAILTAVAPRVFSDDDVNEITHSGVKKLLFVFGTVVYKDAFGASRYIKVCQEILWLANGSQMSRNYGNYNEAN